MKPILIVIADDEDAAQRVINANKDQWAPVWWRTTRDLVRTTPANHIAIAGPASSADSQSLLRLAMERGKRFIYGINIQWVDNNNGKYDASFGLELTSAHKRIQELETLINTPLVDNFLKALPLEAAHQQERWGTDHDAGKTPFDWVFLIGHLATRAAMKLKEGNREKALHHTITTAAVCLNWHRHMQGELTRFRPGTASE